MPQFWPPRTIETDQVMLRPFNADDAQSLFVYLMGDAEVTRWLPAPMHRSVDESRQLIAHAELEWTLGAGFLWGMFSRDGNHLLAAVELRSSPPRGEIGLMSTRLARSHCRRAGLSLFLRLLDWLLANTPLCRLHAFCVPEGPAASTMERLGFTLEGRLTNWLPLPNTAPGIGDALLFALTRAPGTSTLSTSATPWQSFGPARLRAPAWQDAAPAERPPSAVGATRVV
jgi:RimJ/RimL family protein N-acetyltransferase